MDKRKLEDMLRKACELNQHKKLAYLLDEKGGDPFFGENILIVGASHYGSLEVVKLLIDRGADVNAHHSSAVVNAIEMGHKQILILLLQRGARLDFEMVVKAREKDIKLDVVLVLIKFFVFQANESGFKDNALQYLIEHEYDRKH